MNLIFTKAAHKGSHGGLVESVLAYKDIRVGLNPQGRHFQEEEI